MKRTILILCMIILITQSIMALDGEMEIHLLGIITPIEEQMSFDDTGEYIYNDYIVFENEVMLDRWRLKFLNDHQVRIYSNSQNDDIDGIGKYTYENNTLKIDISEPDFYFIMYFHLDWIYQEGGIGVITHQNKMDLPSIDDGTDQKRDIVENTGVIAFRYVP